MSTYREVIYMVLDFLKLSSDDAYYTEDHVKSLLTNYRAYVLQSRYGDNRRHADDTPAESNYQTIELNLQQVSKIEGLSSSGRYLRSIEELPVVLKYASKQLWAGDMFSDSIIFTMPTRFKYAGTGHLGKLFSYATIGKDHHLYIKSGNPQVFYLEQASFKCIFEDPEKVYELQVAQAEAKGEDIPEFLDQPFPLEDNLLALCMQYVVKELNGGIYKPKDSENNAADDLSELANFIRSYTKSPLQKQIYG